MPNTTTPVNAENLNAMQNNIEAEIATKSDKKVASGNLYNSKWYRFAKLGSYSSLGLSFIVNIWTRYGSTNNSAFTLAVNVTHNAAQITQISGLENVKNVIDKVRVVKDTSDSNVYLELFYGADAKSNQCRAEIASFASITMLDFTDTTDTVTVLDELNLQSSNIITGTEFETGRVIDGKKEYGKFINFGNLGNATNKTVAHGLTNVTFTKIVAHVTNGNVSFDTPYGYALSDSNGVSVSCNVQGSYVQVTTNSDRTGYTAVIELNYLKN